MNDRGSQEQELLANQEGRETESRHELSEKDLLKRRVLAVLERVDLDVRGLAYVEETLQSSHFKLLPESQQVQLKNLNRDLRTTLLRAVNELNAAIEKIGFDPADFARDFPDYTKASQMAEPARKEAEAKRLDQERQQRSLDLQRRLQEEQAERAALEAAEAAEQARIEAAKEAEGEKSVWMNESVEKIKQSLAKFHPDLVEARSAGPVDFAMFLNDRLAEEPRAIVEKIVHLPDQADWTNSISIGEITETRDGLIATLETMFANDKANNLILPPTEDEDDTVRMRRPDVKKALGEAKSETVKARLRKEGADENELADAEAVDVQTLERFEDQTWREIRSIIGEDDLDLFQNQSIKFEDKTETIPIHALSRLREINELLLALEHSPSTRVQETIKAEIAEAINTVREVYSAVIREPKPKSPEEQAKEYFNEFATIYNEIRQMAGKASTEAARNRLHDLYLEATRPDITDPKAIPENVKKNLVDTALDVYKEVNGHEFSHEAYYAMPMKERESSGGQAIISLAGHLGLRSYLIEQFEERPKKAAEKTKQSEAAPIAEPAPAQESAEQKREIPPAILKALDDLREATKLTALDDPQLKRLYELAETEGNPKEWHPHIQQEIMETADELLRAGRIDLDPKIAWNAKVAKLATFEPQSALFKRKGIDNHTIEYLRQQTDKLLKKLKPDEERGLQAMTALREQMDYKQPEHLEPDSSIRVADIEKMLKQVGPAPERPEDLLGIDFSSVPDQRKRPEAAPAIPEEAKSIYETLEDIRTTAGTPDKEVPLVDRYKELVQSPGSPDSWPEATINELVDIAQRILQAGGVPPEVMEQKLAKLKTELPQKRAA